MQHASPSHLETASGGLVRGLVVSPNKMHFRRKSHLKSDKVQRNLARKHASVDVISQEEVLPLGRLFYFVAFHRGGGRWATFTRRHGTCGGIREGSVRSQESTVFSVFPAGKCVS